MPPSLLPIPETIDDAITRLLQLMPQETKDGILFGNYKAIEFHSGFGRNLRNTWGFWTESQLKNQFLALGVTEADDMSGILLESVWRVVQGKAVDLETQVRDCKAWYEQQGNPQ